MFAFIPVEGEELWCRSFPGEFIMNRVYLSLCIALLLILTGSTLARNTVWQDELSSWGDIVAKTRTNREDITV
jgi:hypothetical protein